MNVSSIALVCAIMAIMVVNTFGGMNE